MALAHAGSKVTAVHVACLYGDEAARRAGYPPLGLPHRAGYALARDDARGGPAPETLVAGGAKGLGAMARKEGA